MMSIKLNALAHASKQRIDSAITTGPEERELDESFGDEYGHGLSASSQGFKDRGRPPDRWGRRLNRRQQAQGWLNRTVSASAKRNAR
jgi:hypothetical protein